MPPQVVTLQGFKCERCGHVWVPLNIEKPPKNCPNKKCKSPYWDRARKSG